MNKKTVVFAISLITTIVSIAIVLSIPHFIVTSSSPLDKSIVKQFVYDIDPTYPPVAGLNVDLFNSQLSPVAALATDTTGYVTFTDLVDETYTLKWMWGGVEGSDVIQVTCEQLVWDLGTNYLESKSGGGLRLAEARGQASHASHQG